MKLLFVGPIQDFSGFATASRHLLQSLLQDERLEVVTRPLKYDQLDPGQTFEIPDWMQAPLQRDLQNVDIAVQMTTCNIEAVPVPGVLNILYTFLESDRVQGSWAQKANEFDILMVPCKDNAEALMRSGVTKAIMVCPPPCDKDEYAKEYESFSTQLDLSGRTVFYNICQLSAKKGIDVLLRAYFAAFCDAPNDVVLVLKTYINMGTRSSDLEQVKQYINTVKQGCRIPVQELPPVLPLVYTMSDDEIHGLHKRGDCYVCSSRAEGWGIPVFDALSHGNSVISHTAGGLGAFVNEGNTITYGGTSSLFFNMNHPDPGLFTGVEQCFEPSPAELAFCMRRYHLLRKGNEDGVLDESNNKEWQSVLHRIQNAKQLSELLDYRVTHDRIVGKIFEAYDSWKTSGVVKFQREEVDENPS